MRIVLAGQTYLPSTNGPAVFTTRLAEALVAQGHPVMAIVPSPDGRRHDEERAGVAVHALPAIAWRHAGVAVTAYPNARVGRLLDAFGADVVHIQDHYPTSRSVLAESRRRGLPVVATHHFVPKNIALQLPLPARLQGSVEALLWWTVRTVFQRVDVATAPSETAARLIRDRLAGPAVQPISCGVDVARFRPRSSEERARLRRRFGLPASGAALLYVGRLDRDKNLERLLDATARAPAVERLVIAGKGMLERALRQRARRLGLEGRVHFSGYVPDDALPDLYAACDLFVMPSSVELLSIASLEAMASGRPVLAADAGALPELVRAGRNGELFDPYDVGAMAGTLQALASAPRRWPQLGRESRACAEEHRLQRTRDRFAALYREVVAERDRSASRRP